LLCSPRIDSQSHAVHSKSMSRKAKWQTWNGAAIQECD